MKKEYPELPGWSFDLEEISASVYKVVGKDRAGRVASVTGTNLDQTIEQCKQRAKEINDSLGRG